MLHRHAQPLFEFLARSSRFFDDTLASLIGHHDVSLSMRPYHYTGPANLAHFLPINRMATCIFRCRVLLFQNSHNLFQSL